MSDGSGGAENGSGKGVVDIDLRFGTMRELQLQLAPWLSSDGLFIGTDEPQPPDAVIHFRVVLPDDFVLIDGTGVVIWSRDAEDEHGPPGMAIRYAFLSREAQETIDAVIDAHLASGGDLFNIDPSSGDDTGYPTDALAWRPPIVSDEAPGRRKDSKSQLELARVTIRGEPGSGIDNDYLASVENQVEEAVASIGPAGRREPAGPPDEEPAAPHRDAESPADRHPAEPSFDEPEPDDDQPLVVELDDDEQVVIVEPVDRRAPPPSGERRDEPRSSRDEPVLIIGAGDDDRRDGGLEERSEAAAEPTDEPVLIIGAAGDDREQPVSEEWWSRGGAEPADAAAPEPSAPAAGPAPGESAGESQIDEIIPVFLERWKQEIGTAETTSAGQAEDGGEIEPHDVASAGEPGTEPPEVEPVRAPRRPTADRPLLVAEPVTRGPAVEPPMEPAVEPTSATAQPGADRPEREEVRGSAFEVSVLEPDEEAEIVRRARPEPTDEEVTLLAAEPERPRRRWRLWAVPAIVAPLVAAGVYLGWDRITGLVDSLIGGGPAGRAAESTAQRTEGTGPASADDTTGPVATDQGSEGVADVAVVEQAADEAAAPALQPTTRPTEVPQAVAAAPARAIERISWADRGDATEVTIVGNGAISEDVVSVFPMRDPPRILVRVRRIDQPYPTYELDVGSAQLSRIRIGHHPEQQPPALYVVLDLADPLAGVADVTVEGAVARVLVARQ